MRSVFKTVHKAEWIVYMCMLKKFLVRAGLVDNSLTFTVVFGK